MSEGLLVIFILTAYLLLVFGPTIGIIVNRGRQTGRVGPKLSATLIALTSIGIPATGGWIFFGIKKGVWLILPFWGVIMLMFSVMWLAAYAGPLGIGWIGKWDHYIYPQKKKQEPQPGAEVPKAQTEQSVNMLRSWRAFTLTFVTSELIVFVVVSIALSIDLLAVLGIGLALLHWTASLLFWHWKQQLLRERGWRW